MASPGFTKPFRNSPAVSGCSKNSAAWRIHTSLNGAFYKKARRTVNANHHVDAALSRAFALLGDEVVPTSALIRAFRPTPQFVGRRLRPQHIQHVQSRFRVRIVRIVQHRGTVPNSPLAAHLPWRQSCHSAHQFLGLDTKQTRHRNARQNIQHAMPPSERRLKMHALHVERSLRPHRTSASAAKP